MMAENIKQALAEFDIELLDAQYLRQLSYDNASDIKYLLTNKRLKRAILNKDFERLKKM